MRRGLQILLLAAGLLLAAPAARGTGDKNEGTLTVVDAKGKEYKLKDWRFVDGTRNLNWLPGNPEALEFYEGTSTPLKRSVLTYVPLTSVRSITFDPDGKAMTVRVARSAKEVEDVIMLGKTGYIGFNSVRIKGTEDGKDVDLEGGVSEGVLKLTFPAPKPLPAPAPARTATVKHVEMKFPTLEVVGLEPLYAEGNGMWKTLPKLYFNDGSKFDLGDFRRVALLNTGTSNYQVTFATGKKSYKSLLAQPSKGSDFPEGLELYGFVGRFNGGYRTFPLITVKEIELEDAPK
jgi:hypothetical protein